jgi:isopenicillin N synthase-like dioxygenase
MGVSADIPIIDLSGDEADVARQLVSAAEDHGFIYIKSLGQNVTPESINEAFRLVRERPSK